MKYAALAAVWIAVVAFLVFALGVLLEILLAAPRACDLWRVTHNSRGFW